MAKPGRSRWFRAAKWLAAAFLLLLAFLAYLALQESAPQGCEGCLTVQSNAGLLLGLGALLFTGLGTISSVILGWRSERRQAAESRLRVAQLELELARARADSGQAP
jgi:hypothetical protein